MAFSFFHPYILFNLIKSNISLLLLSSYLCVVDTRKSHHDPGHMRVTLCPIQWKLWLRDYEKLTKLLCMLRSIWLAE